MTDYCNPLDLKFMALADPSRRWIIERLTTGTLPVSVLAESLNMRLQTVLQHIKVLERSGLVETSKQGRVRTCRLRTAELKELQQWLGSVYLDWDAKLDRLGQHLNEENKNDITSNAQNPDL